MPLPLTPSFKDWEEVLSTVDAAASPETLLWLLKYASGSPEVSDATHSTRSLQWLFMRQRTFIPFTDTLLSSTIESWTKGPPDKNAWRWLAQHENAHLRTFIRLSFRAAYLAPSPDRRAWALKALESSSKVDAQVAAIFAKMQPRDTPPSTLSLQSYQADLRRVIDPTRGGSIARAEVLIALYLDAWPGSRTELIETVCALT